MPITIEELNALVPLNGREGDFAAFDKDEAIGRFVGHVVHHEFRGLSVPERQKRIWDLLRERFGDQSQEVSLVLTYSPDEWEEINVESA